MLLNESGYGLQQVADKALAAKVAAVLLRHYPNYNWMVEANHEAGVVTIRLMYTDRLGRLSRYGCLMHLSSFHGAEGDRKVMMLGGELLERYKLKRGLADPETALLVRNQKLLLDNAVTKSKF